eukprot:2513602-Rhodomonas_salina.4
MRDQTVLARSMRALTAFGVVASKSSSGVKSTCEEEREEERRGRGQQRQEQPKRVEREGGSGRQ